MRTHFRDSDPSSTGGNKVVRTAVAASLVGLMALAGCSGDNAGYRDGTISTPTTAPAPEIATPKEVMLRENVKKEFYLFANAINDTTNTNNTHFRVVTTPSPQNNNQGLTTVEITPDSSLIGTSGEAHYTMMISGDIDPQTHNVDPSKATSIFLGMDTEKGGPKAGQLYMFGIEQAADSLNWEVYYAAETKGGEKDYNDYITGNASPITPRSHVEPLTADQFGRMTTQAEKVLNWAVGAVPINYAPAQ